MTRKANSVLCVDCIHFKTRVIPSKARLEMDEFQNIGKLYKQFAGKRKNVRVYYCFFHRKPLLENTLVHKRLITDCKLVSEA